MEVTDRRHEVARMIVRRSIGVFVIVLAAVAIARAGDAPGLPVPAEEKQVLDALAAGNVDAALAGLPAAVAAREAQARDDAAAAAKAIDHLAAVIFRGGGGSEASMAAVEATYHRALDLRVRAFGEHGVETARSCSKLSTFAFLRGRWDDAESWERRALAIRREALPAGDPAIAGSLGDLGIVLVKQGRLADAEPLLVEAANVYDAAPDAPVDKRLEAQNSLAELYRQEDRLQESEKTLRGAIAAAEKQGADAAPLLARLTNNLGGLLKDEGNLAEAEKLTRRSLALREGATPPDPADLSVAYLNLAEIYRLEGNANEAEPLYLKSIDLAKEGLGPDHPDLATHWGQLAVLCRDKGAIDDARRWSDLALAQLERTLGPDHPLLAQALHDRGALETGDGHPKEALPPLRRALAIREKAFGPSHLDVASTLTELARAQSLSGPDESGHAEENLNRAIGILDATPAYPETAVDARLLRARARRRRGDLSGAAADLTAAAGWVESLRPAAGGGEATRAAFLAKHAAVYEQLVDLRLSQGRVAEAFHWAEAARGRALLDQLASAGVDLRRGIPEPKRSELARREGAARSAVAEWQARADALIGRGDLSAAEVKSRAEEARRSLARAVAELRRVDEEMKNESSLWRASSGGEPTDAQSAETLLSKGERLYAYQLGASSSWLIEIPGANGAPLARRLTVDATAAQALGIAPGPLTAAALAGVLGGPAGLLADMERRPVQGFPDESGSALAALFDVLVPKASRNAWSTAKGVIVIPDGMLARLPFEALVVHGASGQAPARYWIDAGPPIRYAVSATLLANLRARTPSSRTGGLLSVADPDYGGAGTTRWSRLPGTARESQAVVAAFRKSAPGIPLTVLSGKDAGEPAVSKALSGQRYIHLAVHGAVDEGRGDLLAALALAPPEAPGAGPGDDGLLHLFEIYDLTLDCELAVLSSCKTEAGAAVTGEGVFALSRGFLARGARRVVASLWEVDDASTATLMSSFFESLAKAEAAARPADYAASLANAKRAVRSDPATAAPFYWAPFVLSGLR
jgi:tetratricopeptide (TPR) repeat protein